MPPLYPHNNRSSSSSNGNHADDVFFLEKTAATTSNQMTDRFKNIQQRRRRNPLQSIQFYENDNDDENSCLFANANSTVNCAAEKDDHDMMTCSTSKISPTVDVKDSKSNTGETDHHALDYRKENEKKNKPVSSRRSNNDPAATKAGYSHLPPLQSIQLQASSNCGSVNATKTTIRWNKKDYHSGDDDKDRIRCATTVAAAKQQDEMTSTHRLASKVPPAQLKDNNEEKLVVSLSSKRLPAAAAKAGHPCLDLQQENDSSFAINNLAKKDYSIIGNEHRSCTAAAVKEENVMSASKIPPAAFRTQEDKSNTTKNHCNHRLNEDLVSWRSNNKERPAAAPAATKKKGSLLLVSSRYHFSDVYKIGNKLGEGGCASVYAATHYRTSAVYAAKDIDMTGMDSQERFELQDEITALRLLRHGPNIIHLHDVYQETDRIWLVMELMKGGDLWTGIKRRGPFDEPESRKTCRGIFQAMDYMHKRNIAHRDIKPGNILLTGTDDNDSSSIKIADFGSAKRVPKPNNGLLMTLCGTPTYEAPEVYALSGYDHRADMWSVGVVTYILLSGYNPFDLRQQHSSEGRTTTPAAAVLDEVAVERAICQGDYCFHEKYWKGISNGAKDMIRGLLEINTQRRMTAEEALQCPWMMMIVDDDTKQQQQTMMTTMEEIRRSLGIRNKTTIHKLKKQEVLRVLTTLIRDYNFLSQKSCCPAAYQHGGDKVIDWEGKVPDLKRTLKELIFS